MTFSVLSHMGWVGGTFWTNPIGYLKDPNKISNRIIEIQVGLSWVVRLLLFRINFNLKCLNYLQHISNK